MALCYTFTKVKGRKQNESFLYIEHFCVLPKTLMLEIDPPKDDISKRRKGFYERSGFTENEFPHIHPPYHKGNKGHELVLMTCPKKASQDVFDGFSRYLKEKVMKNVFL